MSPAWIAAGITAAGVFALAYMAPRASAAERTLPGEYELSAYRAGRDYRVDRPNVERIGGPYASREACRMEMSFVKVEAGLRLRCDPVEQVRVR